MGKDPVSKSDRIRRIWVHVDLGGGAPFPHYGGERLPQGEAAPGNRCKEPFQSRSVWRQVRGEPAHSKFLAEPSAASQAALCPLGFRGRS